MSQEKKVSRRQAMLIGGLGLATGGMLAGSTLSAEEATELVGEKTWKYVKVCPKKVADRVYKSFDGKGCMYGAMKGAVLEYADQVEAVDKTQAQIARSFPFIAMQAGRSGCGKLKSLCGAVNAGAVFMALFESDPAELTALIQELGKYAAETALPEYKPEGDKYPDFPTAVAHGVSCKEMGGAWMAAASDDYKKIVLERCQRHTASILQKTIELLNKHFNV